MCCNCSAQEYSQKLRGIWDEWFPGFSDKRVREELNKFIASSADGAGSDGSVDSISPCVFSSIKNGCAGRNGKKRLRMLCDWEKALKDAGVVTKSIV
jgi:hypothetical protein